MLRENFCQLLKLLKRIIQSEKITFTGKVDSSYKRKHEMLASETCQSLGLSHQSWWLCSMRTDTCLTENTAHHNILLQQIHITKFPQTHVATFLLGPHPWPHLILGCFSPTVPGIPSGMNLLASQKVQDPSHLTPRSVFSVHFLCTHLLFLSLVRWEGRVRWTPWCTLASLPILHS